MNNREIIILAGGKGTRLSTLNNGLPKCLCMIGNRPFLHYIIDYYVSQGIMKFIFSLGHLHVPIQEELDRHFRHINLSVILEEQPLGTGGAVAAAMSLAQGENVFVANGDTYFRARLKDLELCHDEHDAECSIALTRVPDAGRYGRVSLDPQARIMAFEEKGVPGAGLVNGGIYLIRKKPFMDKGLPRQFSLEKDYLEEHLKESGFFGLPSDGYFIDIGIPEDLLIAQKEMPRYAK